MEDKKFRMQIIDETGQIEASEIFYDERGKNKQSVTLLPAEKERFFEIQDPRTGDLSIKKIPELFSLVKYLVKRRGLDEIKETDELEFDIKGILIITRK